MRIKIPESVVDLELKSLFNEIKDKLNFILVTDKEDEKDYTLIIKGKVLDETLFIQIIHEYNNGNTWNTTFTIHKDDEDRYIIDTPDRSSPYHTRHHKPFNTSEEVIDYIKRYEA